MIKCKHRRSCLAGSAVGTPGLQVLNGTARQVHGDGIAVSVPDGRDTASAVAFAKQQRLHVIDRHTLEFCVRAACLSVGRGRCPRLRRKGVRRP